MILKNVEKEILAKQKKGEWILPFYDKFCLSNIPATILDLFSLSAQRSLLPFFPEKYRKLAGTKHLKVVLLVIDAFGYYAWLQAAKEKSFYRTITKKGTLLPLTSVFPSTTTAGITSLQIGLTPQEHAFFEWHLYLRELDEVILSLPFSPIKPKAQDKLLERGVDPKIILESQVDRHIIYRKLRKAGIPSYVFASEPIAKSVYTTRIFQGGSVVAYKRSSDLVVALRKHLINARGRSYFYTYWDGIDGMVHKYGPNTEEYLAEVRNFSVLLERELLGKLPPKIARDVVILVTADHGHVPISPARTIYLNQYRWLVKNFEKSRRRKPILPCGNPRDIFLHIQPSKLPEVIRKLHHVLQGKAKVIRVEDAIREGFFGVNSAGRKFRERAGNLLILPSGNNSIWYEHIAGKKLDHLGHHGGLLKEEMLISLAIARLSDLI